jgi:hypothetical protein
MAGLDGKMRQRVVCESMAYTTRVPPQLLRQFKEAGRGLNPRQAGERMMQAVLDHFRAVTAYTAFIYTRFRFNGARGSCGRIETPLLS